MVELPTETIRIGMMSAGDPDLLKSIQIVLRDQAADGCLEIVSMDDEIAVIRWRDPAKAALLCGSVR